MNLYKLFRATIKRHNFIEPQDHVLVGVSGGLDSMVLTHLLVSLKKDIPLELSLAHVNYQMRGEESDAQEELVKDFAKKNNLECFVTHLKGTFPIGGTSPKVENFQQMAREFRYHYFAEIALSAGAGKIAVAHHLEDQVETILAQWLRGASLRGLSGMRSFRDLRTYALTHLRTTIQLIRPLLTFSKNQLRAYAQQEQVPFIEDSSNTSPKYWRNRLRHELLPVLHDLRPKAFDKIVRTAGELKEVADFLESEAKKWLKEFAKKSDQDYWLPRPRWLKLPRVLRLEILHQAICSWTGSSKNIKRDHLVKCEQLSLSNKSEGYYPLTCGFRFVRLGDDLLIS